MMFECATDGCTTKTERRSPRHKYCDECARARRANTNKVWYATIGAEWKHNQYVENREEILAKTKTPEARAKARAYQQRPKRKEYRKRWEAERVTLHRERRLQEELNGGRHFRRCRAKTSEPYLPEHLLWGVSPEDTGRGSFSGLEQDQQQDNAGE